MEIWMFAVEWGTVNTDEEHSLNGFDTAVMMNSIGFLHLFLLQSIKELIYNNFMQISKISVFQ